MTTQEILDSIPRGDLVSMLKESAWYSGGRESFGDHQGYSFEVREETSLRDVLYRDYPLYPTPEEALVAYWKHYYQPQPKSSIYMGDASVKDPIDSVQKNSLG